MAAYFRTETGKVSAARSQGRDESRATGSPSAMLDQVPARHGGRGPCLWPQIEVAARVGIKGNAKGMARLN